METLAHLLAAEASSDLAAEVRDQIRADPLTILRVATAIANSKGLLPVESVTCACREEMGLLRGIDPVAVRREMEEMLLGRDVDVALQWLQEIGVIAVYLPELEACVDLVQEAGRQHKDVWAHTKQVVKQAVRRPVIRWAALLHDIGKVPTRTFTRNGVHFHGHAEVGARMFDKVQQRLPFDREMRQKVRFLIKHHLRSNQYSEGWSDSAVRRFHREMGPHLDDLLDLSRADITSKRPGKRRALLHQISALADRIDRLVAEDAVLPPLPSGIGNAVMTHFALTPGRVIGDLKRALEDAIARGDLEARREDAYYLGWLTTSGLVPGHPAPAAPPAAEAAASDGATDTADAPADPADDCCCGDDD
jgi:poly(A) polymerase